MTHASLFSGIGAAELAARWMGWDNLFHCEVDGFCNRILNYWFPESKAYEDIRKTDFTPWRGRVGVLTGGFPCQPFSLAGSRKGAEDDRYLFPEMLRAVSEIRPSWVVGENVAGLITMVQPGSEAQVAAKTDIFGKSIVYRKKERYVLFDIISSLEGLGYEVQPFVIPACAVGAPHRRERIWIVAHRSDSGAEGEYHGQAPACPSGTAPDANGNRQGNGACKPLSWKECQGPSDIGPACPGEYPQGRWRDFPAVPPVCRRHDGLSFNVDRLTISYPRWRAQSVKAYGNSMVPQVVYEIFRAIADVNRK